MEVNPGQGKELQLKHNPMLCRPYGIMQDVLAHLLTLHKTLESPSMHHFSIVNLPRA